MKKNHIIILSVVAALLAAYIFFIENKKITTEDAASLRQKIISVPFNDIMEIRISDIVVKRAAGDTWVIAAPVKSAVDLDEADKIFNIIKTADFTGKQQVNADELKKFSIADNPALAILDRTGKQLIFKRGNKNFDGTYNILSVNDTTIYSVKPEISDIFNLTLTKIRDKKIFDFRTADILSMSIERSKTDILTFVKQRMNDVDYEWNIETPVKAEASWEKVNELIDLLVNSGASEFIDKPGDMPKNNAVASIIFSMKNPDGSVYNSETLIYKNADGGGKMYLQKNAGYPVFVINNENLFSKLMDKYAVFKTEKIFGRDFSDSQLSSVLIKYNSKALELKNKNGKFVLENMVDSTIQLPDEKMISDFIFDLVKFRAERIISDNSKDIFEYNLDKPFMQIFVTTTGGKKTINISAKNDKVFGVIFSGPTIEIFELKISADGKTPQLTEGIINFFK